MLKYHYVGSVGNKEDFIFLFRLFNLRGILQRF